MKIQAFKNHLQYSNNLQERNDSTPYVMSSINKSIGDAFIREKMNSIPFKGDLERVVNGVAATAGTAAAGVGGAALGGAITVAAAPVVIPALIIGGLGTALWCGAKALFDD